ncbi:MAG: hypothetical protein JRC68_06310, partial [Deltaproteobacteria bacterium]|nr:hypothetical protein [Deltaproteobacteria bacterium]
MAKNEGMIAVDVLAEVAGVEEDEAQKLAKAYAGTKKKNLTRDEACRVLIGKRIAEALPLKQAEVKQILEENGLGFDTRSDIVRIHDDGIMVTKMRLRVFKSEFLTDIEKVTAAMKEKKKEETNDESGTDPGPPAIALAQARRAGSDD